MDYDRDMRFGPLVFLRRLAAQLTLVYSLVKRCVFDGHPTDSCYFLICFHTTVDSIHIEGSRRLLVMSCLFPLLDNREGGADRAADRGGIFPTRKGPGPA
jgi:hypothetical protein